MNSTCEKSNKKKILIVEDDFVFREMIGEALSQEFQVAFTENGEHALYELTQSDYDLIITDLLMPIIDGIEFLTRLRRTKPDQKVIVMSGGSYLKWNFEFLSLNKLIGNGIILRKPFSLKLLLTAARKLLSTPEVVRQAK